jgi:hypothetical protein
VSAVCILTPLVIASWPAISSAVAAAAASMGFSVLGPELHKEREGSAQHSVETTLEDSEVVAEGLRPGEALEIRKEDVTIRIAPDQRGRCTVCVTGTRHSDRALRKIGDTVAGRIVQQFTYNKLLTELKNRSYRVASEEVLADQSIRIHIRQ